MHVSVLFPICSAPTGTTIWPEIPLHPSCTSSKVYLDTPLRREFNSYTTVAMIYHR